MKFNKYKSRIRLSKREFLIATASILAASCLFIFWPSFYSGPSYKGVKEVWLPPRNSETWFDEGYRSAIENVKSVQGKYGKAVLFSSTEGMDFKVYIANKSDKLKVSDCPNVFNLSKDETASCRLRGAIPGSVVYSFSPSIASGAGVGYMTRDNVFIAFKTGGDQGDSNVYKDAKKFKRVDINKIDSILSGNKAWAEERNSVIRKAQAEEKYKQSQAYLHLKFTPYLPSTLPEGWTRNRLEIISTNPEDPAFIEAQYVNREDDYITLRVGKLSQFKLGPTCGPSPGAGGAYLKCEWNPVAGYYRASDQGDDYTQNYIYKPLGETIAIVDTDNCCDSKRPPLKPSLLSVQEAIAQALQPVNTDAVKTAKYNEMSYF